MPDASPKATLRTEPNQTGTYVFDNAWTQTARRLELLEQLFDLGTTERLGALGVGPGWHCLEVGAGSGSVARWLSKQVGPGGTVVATDIDTRLLEPFQGGNLHVVRHDVVTDPLPEGDFDLVHTRGVLLHIPAREQVIDRLIAALRPGGSLLLEEADFYSAFASPSSPIRQAWQTLTRGCAAAGMAAEWARELPGLLDARGLIDVSAEVEAPMSRGGTPLAEVTRITFVQAWEQFGEPLNELDAIVAALSDPRQWFSVPALIVVRARKPLGRRGSRRSGRTLGDDSSSSETCS